MAANDPIRIGHVEAKRQKDHWSVRCTYCGDSMRLGVWQALVQVKAEIETFEGKHRHELTGFRDKPAWHDGIPANLEAAGHDALHWLKWWQHASREPTIRAVMSDDAIKELWRLNEAIKALESFLPPLADAVYDVAPATGMNSMVIASTDREMMVKDE